jgi:hypothetical protein
MNILKIMRRNVLLLHNITAKTDLHFGSETSVMRKREKRDKRSYPCEMSLGQY